MDFKSTEKSAYNGNYVDYDGMNPPEYKYFTRLAKLGREFRAGKHQTPGEVAGLRNGYYEQYMRDRKAADETEVAYKKWVETVRITESLRVHINGEENSVAVAALALRALWMVTGDCMIEKKMYEMEKRYEGK